MAQKNRFYIVFKRHKEHTMFNGLYTSFDGRDMRLIEVPSNYDSMWFYTEFEDYTLSKFMKTGEPDGDEFCEYLKSLNEPKIKIHGDDVDYFDMDKQGW